MGEISPFVPAERGITLAYKVWSKMSLMEGPEKMKVDERSKLREVPAVVDATAATREKSKAEELEALVQAHRGERHIIVLQSFPDPDAISSAFAHQMIAARHDIECDIARNDAE